MRTPSARPGCAIWATEPVPPASRTAEIRALAATDEAAALALLGSLLHDLFGIEARDLAINRDAYSLNSLNGFFVCDLGPCFFKFHQEEGEEAMRGEYYRADILARAGLPVDQPLLTSALPGEQVLVYARRSDPRFSDVLRALDLAPDARAAARALKAEAVLNDHLLAVAQDTLAPITPDQSEAEPIHRLFHQRLIDPRDGTFPGGRLSAFYVGKRFDLGGTTLDWQTLAAATPVLNGQRHRATFGELFRRAQDRLSPRRLADAGGIVAHGDAHNANVWYERGAASDRLRLFDPAFAGDAVPSLLAEVKSTFHNTLAHPFWLYDSPEATQRFAATVRHSGGDLVIETDWQPSPLRRDLLGVKATHFWRPWLGTLRDRDLLPDDWEEVLRLALFLCPTLVMNLRAGPGGGPHSPTTSAIGLFVALMAGSPPETGTDVVSDFIEAIRPGPGTGSA